MLFNITQFIFHGSFFKLICAKLGIDWTLHLKLQSNFWCCENFSRITTGVYSYTTLACSSTV